MNASLWPADQVKRRPITELLPYANNPREHSADQVEQLANAITEYGWTMPCLVDEAGVLIAGHGRVLAAQRLGLDTVPVAVAIGWSEARKRQYRIWDNQSALLATWNVELLSAELHDLAAAGENMDLLGFGQVELVQFMAGLGEVDERAEETPEPPKHPVSRRGDVWMLGKHRLACGDCTNTADVERLLAGAKPHLMVTDPPYGVDYKPEWRNESFGEANRAIGRVENDDRADWREAWQLFPGDVGYVWHAGTKSTIVAYSLVHCGFSIRAQIIWAKQHFVIGRGDYHVQHEPCWYAVKKKGHWSSDRKQTTLWQINNNLSQGGGRQEPSTGHSTQKPIECMKRPIENNSKIGEAVYDPFVGSGTTIIAAEIAKRKALALEIEPAYVDVAVLRWQTYAGKDAVHADSGRTFEQTKTDRQRKARRRAPLRAAKRNR